MHDNGPALTATDVAFLRKIYTQALTDDDTDLDLQTRADDLVRLFQEGVSSEKELLARLDQEDRG